LPGSSLFPLSSTLQTPASGAADSYTFGSSLKFLVVAVHQLS